MTTSTQKDESLVKAHKEANEAYWEALKAYEEAKTL